MPKNMTRFVDYNERSYYCRLKFVILNSNFLIMVILLAYESFYNVLYQHFL